MKIEIQAQVQQAIAALKNVQTQLGNTDNAVKTTAKTLPQLGKGANNANIALVNFGRVVQDAPFGLIGIANNIDPLINSFQQLKAQTGSSASAFKALASTLIGPAGIAIAVSAITSILIAYGDQIGNAILGTNQFGKAIQEATDGSGEAAVKINILVAALNSGSLSIGEQAKAQAQLIKLSPEFSGAFKDGATNAYALDEALKKVTASLVETVKIQAATSFLQKEFEKLINTIAQGGELSTWEAITSGIKGVFSPLDALTIAANKTANNFISAQDKVAGFGDRVNEVFKALGINYSAFVKGQKDTKDAVDKTNNSLQLQATLLQNQIPSRSRLNDLSAQDLKNLKEAGISLGDLQSKTDQLIKTREKQVIQSFNDKNAISALQGSGADKADPIQLLDNTIQKANELSGIINNGINGGIDTFFNALANNQDPFKALAQSVQRLVVELGAAVVKMLIIKAISTAITGGGNLALGGAAKVGGSLFSGLIGGSLRGDQFRLLAFGR